MELWGGNGKHLRKKTPNIRLKAPISKFSANIRKN